MKQKEKIMKYLKEKNTATGRELCNLLSISRQALNKHIKELIKKGYIEKHGRTHGTKYSIAGKRSQRKQFKRAYTLKNLEEHTVFKEISMFLNLQKNLNENVFHIVNYVVSEILNNAIEHSRSKKCNVEVILDEYTCKFVIRDYGIGIFFSIYKKFQLKDEFSAIGELIKGKTTTMKEKHSGEGVFFSSKSGDKVIFRSHRISLIFDNKNKDIFAEKRRFLKGTKVIFIVSRSSKRKLEDIFEKYSPEEFDYKFEKTRVMVKLFKREYISRSEAKRLLTNLNKFKEIILDFKHVKSMGQGFADEVFRVFKINHPHIKIKIENLSPVLMPIIEHVVDNKNKDWLTIS
ncbi:MAG: DUF4325 domain-containing protein [Promethearchaeota archaeon]|nr:MAG: DUF4325 domain-containing protein [Candidatus Lokiarchaeota archaeon]